MKNIVVIGGGTGTSTLLKGLKKYDAGLSVIVSTSDDGGSTGKLREKFGVLPPGDIRQCIVALSQNPKAAENLNFRFVKGPFKGHALGNLILANLEKCYGINKSVTILSKALNVKGRVLPVTLVPTTLSAILENGKVINGEHNIDEPKKNLESRIKNLVLKPNASANPKAIAAIKSANVIIFGPGDLYTSTIPNLLVKGMKECLNKSSAKKILITNIMTKLGQTDGYKVSDFLKILERYLGGKVDIVLVNNKKPNSEVLKRYAKEKAEMVKADLLPNEKSIKVITANLISNKIVSKILGDKLNRSLLRHDPEKLAKIIWSTI